MLSPTNELPDDQRFLVSTVPASRAQVRLAGWVLLTLVLALVVTVPFARVRLDDTEILLPAYATAVLMTEVITSALLFVLVSIQRSRAMLVLAAGYLSTALLIIPWALTFPGVFGPVRPARRRDTGYRPDRGGPARGAAAFHPRCTRC